MEENAPLKIQIVLHTRPRGVNPDQGGLRCSATNLIKLQTLSPEMRLPQNLLVKNLFVFAEEKAPKPNQKSSR